MDKSKTWLDLLVVGDEVIIDRGNRGQTVGTVERLTQTQIIVDVGEHDPARYRKSSGRLVGENTIWDSNYLRQATPERLEKVRHLAQKLRLSNALLAVKWGKLSNPAMDRIMAIVKQDLKET